MPQSVADTAAVRPTQSIAWFPVSLVHTHTLSPSRSLTHPHRCRRHDHRPTRLASVSSVDCDDAEESDTRNAACHKATRHTSGHLPTGTTCHLCDSQAGRRSDCGQRGGHEAMGNRNAGRSLRRILPRPPSSPRVVQCVALTSWSPTSITPTHPPPDFLRLSSNSHDLVCRCSLRGR